jgi:predicted DNA binding CopG/RHH family protein
MGEKNMKKKYKLTKEEQAIERSLATDEWTEASIELQNEIIKAAKNNVNQRKREARVNIRLTQFDLDAFKILAQEEGLGYQTLMSSVLHKYIIGKLVDKNIVNKITEDITSQLLTKTRKKTAS